MTEQVVEQKTPPDVTFVRRFKRTGMEMGISFVDGSWYVFTRGKPTDGDWAMHCGPYSDAGQARQWIADIVETVVK